MVARAGLGYCSTHLQSGAGAAMWRSGCGGRGWWEGRYEVTSCVREPGTYWEQTTQKDRVRSQDKSSFLGEKQGPF